MRQSISLLILFLICSASFAQEIKYKDVPDDHWAKSSVYRLTKDGITQGYPDGTFRGLKNMTREEMAAFISNMAKQNEDYSDTDRTLSELKSELSTVKYERDNPLKPQISGQLLNTAIIGNPLTMSGPHGPDFNYRLILSAFEKVGQNASIRGELDTLDAGYGGGVNRNLGIKMLNFEGKLILGNTNIRGVLGPGTITHRETDHVNYSDDYKIFIKPKSGIYSQTYIGNMDIMLDYVTRQVNYLGYVGVDEITARFAYTFNILPILGRTIVWARPRYLWTQGDQDMVAEFYTASQILPTFGTELLVGVGSLKSASGLYAKASGRIETENTSIRLIVNKVGNEYRKPMDKYEFIGLNLFDKLVLDGSVDIGFEFIQKINRFTSLQLRSDAALTSNFKYGKEYPGTSIISEISLNSKLSEAVGWKAFYRTYLVPSTISSSDPTMITSVPEMSDILGFALNFSM